MDVIGACLMVIALCFAATGDQSRTFYAVMRMVMPILALAVLVDVIDREVGGLWWAWVLLSGLIFIPAGDRLPRLVWFPINLGVIGLYGSYAGLVVWQQLGIF